MSTQQEEVESPEIHFEPLVKLAPVETATLEENEEEIFKMYEQFYFAGEMLIPSVLNSILPHLDYFLICNIQSNLVSEYTWGPSKLLLTISSTC